MADTDFAFSSTWLIDQIIAQDTTGLMTPTNSNQLIYTIPSEEQVGGYPFVLAYYKINGQNHWNEFGNELFIRTTTTGIYLYMGTFAVSPGQVYVRWYLFNDKVDH